MKVLRAHIIMLVTFGVLAGAAWVGAWYAYRSVLALRDAKAAAAEAAQKEERTRASAALLRSAVEESAPARAKLEALAHADVVGIASAIESAGKAAGAKVRVSDVSPLPDGDAQRASLTGVHTVGYAIEGTGTFQQLMTVVELLESLPAPAFIEQLTLARAQGGVPGWKLTIRLRVLTAMSAS